MTIGIAVLFVVIGTTPAESLRADEPDATATVCRANIALYHRIFEHRPNESDAARANTVTPYSFRRQMSYLADNDYSVVPYDRLVDCLTGGAAMPEKSVIITFDDGSVDQFDNAFPVLVEHGFPATFFVPTSSVGRPGSMSWEQLVEMADGGMTIGSHGMTHRGMLNLADEELNRELVGSREALESRLGLPVKYFAYPFGLVNDRAEAAVRAAGYVSARGAERGLNHTPGRLFRLWSNGIGDGAMRF